jgi:hypothetical protein
MGNCLKRSPKIWCDFDVDVEDVYCVQHIHLAINSALARKPRGVRGTRGQGYAPELRQDSREIPAEESQAAACASTVS